MQVHYNEALFKGRAETQGAQAFQSGLPLDGNPYPLDHVLHESWGAGWSAAKVASEAPISVPEMPAPPPAIGE